MLSVLEDLTLVIQFPKLILDGDRFQNLKTLILMPYKNHIIKKQKECTHHFY